MKKVLVLLACLLGFSSYVFADMSQPNAQSEPAAINGDNANNVMSNDMGSQQNHDASAQPNASDNDDDDEDDDGDDDGDPANDYNPEESDAGTPAAQQS